MSGSNLKTFTDANFDSEVMGSSIPVVADLWAPWCGPCKMLTPIIDGIAPDYAGRVLIGAMNVDDSPATANKLGIVSIPTILFIKNGQIVDKHVGLMNKDALRKKIDALL